MEQCLKVYIRYTSKRERDKERRGRERGKQELRMPWVFEILKLIPMVPLL